MAGSTSKVLLLGRVGLINHSPARLERRYHGREELTLQKEKDYNQIVLLTAEILHDIQVANLGKNRTSGICALRILLSLFDTDFGNI
jgi:hypothetical protein